MEYKLSFQDLQVVTLKWSLFMRDYYKTCKSPLSGNQSYVLSCYYFLPQITIREICANLEISKQQMTKILAVLEKRAGFYFSNLDAYLNVVGGLRIDEPAVDLAVAMALVSSLKDTPIRDDTVVFGEIGLAGELRSVSHIEARVSEAFRLGFTRCVLPYHSVKNMDRKRFEGMELLGVRNVREAFEACV